VGAPVFASFEAVMGPRVYRLVYPDRRTAQGAAVADVCRSADVDAWRHSSASMPL
jgi:hypothetical protein